MTPTRPRVSISPIAAIEVKRGGLAGVVDGVGDERQKTSVLDGADDAGLLFAAGTGAPGGFDFAGRRNKLDQDVEPLIINIFGLEFGYGLSASAAKLSDGGNSFLTRPRLNQAGVGMRQFKKGKIRLRPRNVNMGMAGK